MKFEKIIKSISSFVASAVVFLLACGMYLSSKGFDIREDGTIVLVKQAYAQEEAQPLPEIPDNYAFPTKHSVGADDAPVVLYEYSSLGCSYCATFHLEILPKLHKKYVENGQLRLVFVPFPIDKNSMTATLLAECLPEEKYQEFINLMYKKQREWGLSRNPQKVLKQYAALSGLESSKIESCLHNDDNAREIFLNRQNAVGQLGIQGTPSFVISYKGKSEMIAGAQSFDRISALIDERLAIESGEAPKDEKASDVDSQKSEETKEGVVEKDSTEMKTPASSDEKNTDK